MNTRGTVVQLIRRLAMIGVAEPDPDPLRAQKATLTIAAACVGVLAVAWVATYWVLGIPAAAAIPFAYQVASVGSLVVFARTKSYPLFRGTQTAMMTVLPFLLQWTIGGYVASSAVSLWALVAAIGTLFFYTPSASIPWFMAFLGLSILSGVIDPIVAETAASIPDSVRIAFFVLNVGGVSVTAYALLQYAVRTRDDAFERSEGLLLNVLPRSIAERLKRDRGVIAESHPDVTVLFADVVSFTPFTERTEPAQVVGVLDEIFSTFDALAERHGLEKIKTIGDAYMVAAGLPEARADHAQVMADMALEMLAEFERVGVQLGSDHAIRIGMHSGPVIAGVIGSHKFAYDLWGDTVNTASRMESHGIAGRVQVTEEVYRRLEREFVFDRRGEIDVKGKGRLVTYLLLGRRPAS